MTVTYACAICGGPITVADNRNGGLIAVNVDGHAKAAHRECPNEDDEAMRADVSRLWAEEWNSDEDAVYDDVN